MEDCDDYWSPASRALRVQKGLHREREAVWGRLVGDRKLGAALMRINNVTRGVRMDKTLDFNEADLLNATWSGMKALRQKKKKDATDANALSKGLSVITKYMETKTRWAVYCAKNPDMRTVAIPLLQGGK